MSWHKHLQHKYGSTVEVWLLKKSYCMGYEEKFLHGLLLLTECTKTSQPEQHWTWGAPPIKTKILGSIEIVPKQNRMLLCLCRAIAPGLVSPVSTVPLFPLLVAYLVLPIISTIARRMPTQRPKAHRYHVETCEMAANNAIELFHESSFQQLSVLTSE